MKPRTSRVAPPVAPSQSKSIHRNTRATNTSTRQQPPVSSFLGSVTEYRFHPTRKWRFDFAWPDRKVAVEVNGGVWNRGRHTRGRGYINDLEKLNTAQVLGWIVLQFTPQQMKLWSTQAAIVGVLVARSPGVAS